MSSVELERKVRGYQPWPGAYAELVYSETKRIQLHIRAARAVVTQTDSKPVGAAWSTTASALGQSGPDWSAPWDTLLAIQTGSGVLVAALVQPSGKRAMTVAEFLRGHPLTPQARF